MKVYTFDEHCADTDSPSCQLINLLLTRINDKIDEVALAEKKVGICVLKVDGKKPTYKYRLCVGCDLNYALTATWESRDEIVNTLSLVETVLNTFL